MSPLRSRPVTPAQWLAVLAICGLAAYGAFAGKPAEATADQAHLVACR